MEEKNKHLDFNYLSAKTVNSNEELKKITPYLNALKDTIEQGNEDITNIAITGAYGAGKSTVLKTFQDKNKDNEYLNISLASFTDNIESKNDSVDNNLHLERKLELNILQQIFYQVNPNDIPHSRFKRIINVPFKKLILISFGVVVWLYSSILIFQFGYFEKFNPTSWDRTTDIDVIAILSFVVFFIGIAFAVYNSIGMILNSKISKVNIKGEVELGSRFDKSVFNEHLEEIFYFFERTKFNVVIFEDIDRFESTDIFTKLRDLNILLNKSKSIERTIIFVYAIRDDIFTNKLDRVKFFDFIIPIIPYINPTSAKEQLTILIKKHKLENELSKTFTNDLVFFIDDIDMRLLINIFNEYLIYREKLNTNQLNQENLFAMVTYKNIFPNDFGKLQRREGVIYHFINNKKAYIKQKITKINKDIKEIEEKIDSINNENNLTSKELRMIHLFKIIEIVPGSKITSFDLNNQEYSLVDMIKRENFNMLFESQEINYYHYDNNNHYSHNHRLKRASFSSDMQKIEDLLLVYKKRLNNILSKSNNTINELKDKIQKLKEQKYIIEHWSLEEVLNNIPMDMIQQTISNEEIDRFNEIIFNNKLMRYLLWNGHINDDFNDYITLFYEISMTKKDFSFVRNVKVNESASFEDELTNINEIINQLEDKHFRNKAVLNFHLLDYLLENHSKYSEQLESVIITLSDESNNSIDFINRYLQTQPKQLEKFLNDLCRAWTNLWNYLYNENYYYSDDILDLYLKLIIENVDINVINLLNNKGLLKYYIENIADFFNLFGKSDYSKLTTVIRTLNIAFKEVDDNSSELLKYVYENNHYQINVNNIMLIFNSFSDKESDSVSTANYTTILSSTLEPLKKYIDVNIESYVNEVLLKLANNSNETETTIIKLLNREDLPVKSKNDILVKQKCIISDISSIKDIDIKELLFENNKIKANWSNVQKLFYANKEPYITEVMINFLNDDKNYNEIAKNELIEKDNIDFLEQIFKCDTLNIDAYRALIKSITIPWINIELNNIQEDKVRFLISSKKLSFNYDSFINLRNNYPNLSVSLIENNLTEFKDEVIEKFNEYNFTEFELYSILSSKSISKTNKVALIYQINEYHDAIESNQLLETLASILLQNNKLALSRSLIMTILERISLENKIKLFNMYFDDFDEGQIINFIKKLPNEYPKILLNKKKPKFNNTNYNEQLFENLKSIDLISSWKLEKDKIRVIAKY